jgi:hypothetical protein
MPTPLLPARTGEPDPWDKALKAERDRLAERPVEASIVDADQAIGWLSSLGTLWAETSDAGRRELALATFARLEVSATSQRGSHRIVSVEATEEAERRGLILALPASLEVTVVGDTGVSPTRVTSWPIRIVRREEWLATLRARSA